MRWKAPDADRFDGRSSLAGQGARRRTRGSVVGRRIGQRKSPSRVADCRRACRTPPSTRSSADLEEFNGRSLVIAGDGQPPEVHALAHACNRALGNIGTTVRYVEPVEAEAGRSVGVAGRAGRRFAGRSRAGLADRGGNPVYNTPAELNFSSSSVAAWGSATVPEFATAAVRPFVGLLQRDVASVALAHSGRPRTRIVERRAGVRRHRHDPAAADRSAVRRKDGSRIAVGRGRGFEPSGLRHRARILAVAMEG